MHIEKITDFINSNAQDICRHFHQERVDIYLFLYHKLKEVHADQHSIYRFIFRSYYGMDTIGLTEEFKIAYFKLQEKLKAGHSFDLAEINEQLSAYRNHKNQPVLPFSLITKMVNMISADYPVYDLHVIKLFGYKQPSDKDTEKRMTKYLKQYEYIRQCYQEIEEKQLLHQAEDIFKHHFVHQILPGYKMLDFLFHAGGKYLLKKKK